jgi:predicted transcriptional regulator
MPPDAADLPPAELEVLKVLWNEAPLSVREVMNRLHAQGRELAYTTVLTFLSRLEQKGCVRSRKEGMAKLYEPAMTRDRVERSRLRSLLDELYDGSAAPLILRLVAEAPLTADELGELQALIDRLDEDGTGDAAPRGGGGRRVRPITSRLRGGDSAAKGKKKKKKKKRGGAS